MASGFLHRGWERSALSSTQMMLSAPQIGSGAGLVGDH